MAFFPARSAVSIRIYDVPLFPFRISRSDAAMVNEVLCKFLCHNLTWLIQEQETLGIVPVFWKDEVQEMNSSPAIRPMVRGL
jgi:hypothetical protein